MRWRRTCSVTATFGAASVNYTRSPTASRSSTSRSAGSSLRPGLYVLDEPEAALSIHGQMVLARLIAESVEVGGQFLIATHSPFLLAYPGATVYELDDEGITPVAFDELAATSLWRRFLDDPEHFYQQLLDP